MATEDVAAAEELTRNGRVKYMDESVFGCQLQARVADRLSHCGWDRSRREDISICERLISAAGFPLLDNALKYLTSLYGLYIDGDNDDVDFAIATVELWTSGLDAARLCATLAGEPICPIGGGGLQGCFVGKSTQVNMIDSDETCFWRFESLCAYFSFVLFNDQSGLIEFKPLPSESPD